MSRHVIRTGLAAGAITGALLLAGCHGGSQLGSATEAPAATTATPSASSPATPAASSATTITGTLFYDAADPRHDWKLVRLRGTGIQTVLTGDGAALGEVSPDGRRVAYVTGDLDLMVRNVDGSGARKLRSNVIDAGYGPTWTADSTAVVIGIESSSGQPQPGILTVADRKFVPLPKSIDGIHSRLTGDGKRVFYSDGECAILSARVNGTGVKRVPVLGLDGTANPRRLRACDIVSLNRDGSRMTVDLHTGNQPDGDIGGSQVANAVVDTATGQVVALPVRGKVRAALYRPDGTLLVRSASGGTRTLTLFSARLTVLARMTEPAAVKAFELRDYTR
jgi:TolB protein